MKLLIPALLVLSACTVNAHADTIPVAPTSIDLGAAGSFAVLAGSAVTNTGATVINGNLGVSPQASVTGFLPGVVVNGAIHAADETALLAQGSLVTAYNAVASSPCGTNLTGQDLGGLTLSPGTYCFSSSAQLTGTLTLDRLGDADALFLFQIGSTLNTASGSAILFSGGGDGSALFFQVGSSASLGSTTAFAGNILALQSISLDTGATITCGRALARNGAVTLEGNLIGTSGCGTGTGGSPTEPGGGLTPVPEPGSAALISSGLFGLLSYARRWRQQS